MRLRGPGFYRLRPCRTAPLFMAVFAAVDARLRARNVCESMDLDLMPNSINNVRIKLKRLTGHGILAEHEPGLFTGPRP